jgi:mercuric ion transport protein
MKSASLTISGIASALAGACCVVPLVLVSAGFGGAWLASFQKLEPYRPVFLGIALVALGFAWRAIYRPRAECPPGEVCALPRVRRGYRLGFWAMSLLVAAMFGFPYVAPLFY